MDLDKMIDAMVAKRIEARVEAAIARILGGEPEAPAAPAVPQVVAVAPAAPPAASPARPAPRAGKKTRATPRKAASKDSKRTGGPMPGSVADQIIKALSDGPLTDEEFAKALEAIPGSHEARRQAVTRLTKTGRLVVVDDGKRGRTFRLGSESRPTTGG